MDVTEILPSRFVLVNKSDPRNVHPSDAQLEGAKLKARWIIAGHRDQRAGEFETEAPTASLLGHNLLCFFATQWSWAMSFADVSAAFFKETYFLKIVEYLSSALATTQTLCASSSELRFPMVAEQTCSACAKRASDLPRALDCGTRSSKETSSPLGVRNGD